MKKAIVLLAVILASLTACSSAADVTSQNLSTDADNFKVFRQIVVYNAIADKYVLEVDGYCSLGNDDPAGEVSYTCKSPRGYVKDIIEKSNNTFVFVHQLHPQNVSQDYFKVIIRPRTIVPDISVQ